MNSLQVGLAAIMLVTGALAPASAQESKPALARNVKNVGVEEFDKLRAAPNTVVLDVRTAREFSAGHITGAVNIDFNGPGFQEQIKKLDPSKTYLVHCAGGVRSAKACNAMSKITLTNVVNLEPGFRAWEKAGKPVDKN